MEGTVYVLTNSLLAILSLAATINLAIPHCAVIFAVSSNNQEKESFGKTRVKMQLLGSTERMRT